MRVIRSLTGEPSRDRTLLVSIKLSEEMDPWLTLGQALGLV